MLDNIDKFGCFFKILLSSEIKIWIFLLILPSWPNLLIIVFPEYYRRICIYKIRILYFSLEKIFGGDLQLTEFYLGPG